MNDSDMPIRRKEKITQTLIAREAGVSQTLVSLVLNDTAPERVAEETRKRILETARSLGYQVRGKSQHRKTLALILPQVSRVERLDTGIYDAIDDFYARTQKYATEAALEKGYSLIVRFCEEPVELTHWLTEWDVDGVLWNAGDEKLLEWISKRFPVVQLHLGNPSFPVDTVTANQEEIPVIALRHLYDLGHRRVCFVPGIRWGRVARIRSTAFTEMGEALGVKLYDEFLQPFEADSVWDILNDCMRLAELPLDERPTAFIMGDPAALPFARKLQNKGFSIPGDFSIVGIDNISASALYNPPLTSVDACQREVADTAVEMVVARIANPETRFQKVYISPRVVERESVAAYVVAERAPEKSRRAVKST